MKNSHRSVPLRMFCDLLKPEQLATAEVECVFNKQ